MALQVWIIYVNLKPFRILPGKHYNLYKQWGYICSHKYSLFVNALCRWLINHNEADPEKEKGQLYKYIWWDFQSPWLTVVPRPATVEKVVLECHKFSSGREGTPCHVLSFCFLVYLLKSLKKCNKIPHVALKYS